MTLPHATPRTIARVEDKVRFGPDSQVDDRYVAIAPTDPAATDPFLLLSEDWFSEPGFEWHPHRGLETVTMVVGGVLEHGDNLGNAGALTTGDIQWMTAGRGIIHRELAFKNELAHTLQLWVNLPSELKMVERRYQDLRANERPMVERDGARIDLVSGAVGDTTGPADTHWPISGAIITLEPNATLEHLLPGVDRAFFYVMAGEVTIGGRRVKAGQTAWSDPVKGALLTAMTVASGDGDERAVVMTYSGKPIGQPVVMGGPFVMNSRAEINQALTDFHSGAFGSIPRQARLKYP